jgi:hypothetical protein
MASWEKLVALASWVTAGLLVAGVFAFGAASAAAQGPGAGGDEYSEGIPNGEGQQPTKGAGSNSGGGPTSTPGGTTLPPQAEAALDKQGADGAAAAQLASGTNPSQRGTAQGEGAGGGSAAKAVEGAAAAGGSSGGMGVAFPIALGVSAVSLLLLLFLRRRSLGDG